MHLGIECEFYPFNVSGHLIWVIEVPDGEEKPYFASGSVYVRRGANSQKIRKPSDVRQFFADTGSLHYDEATYRWSKKEDISEQAIIDFKEKAGISSNAEDIDLLRNLRLLNSKGEMCHQVFSLQGNR